MTARAQLFIAALMIAAYALDASWVKPRRRHLDFLSSRDCIFEQRCWIR